MHGGHRLVDAQLMPEHNVAYLTLLLEIAMAPGVAQVVFRRGLCVWATPVQLLPPFKGFNSGCIGVRHA